MNWFSIQLIRLYQKTLSPLLPASCRFYPSCSRYAAESFEKFPFWRALKLSLKRLGRCHPWNPGGVDPVPRKGPRS